MKTVLKKIVTIVVVVMVSLLNVFSDASFIMAEDDNRRVLFISSYSYSFPSVPEQMKGIEQALGESTTINYLFMNTKTVEYETAVSSLCTQLDDKHLDVISFDCIIAGDDAAMQFVLDYRDRFFKDKPIIFEGINNQQWARELSKDPLITGVSEVFPFSQTISLALKVYPKAKNVVYISDDSLSGKGSSAQILESQSSFTDLTFKEINTSQLSEKEIIAEVNKLNEQDIVIMLMMSQNRDGKQYTMSQAVKTLSNNCPVAIFKSDETGIEYGLLGGYTVDFSKMGYTAGDMANRILNGKDVQDIKMVASDTYELLNQDAIDKYKINKNIISKDAVILNEKENFLKEHRQVILPSIFIVMVMLLFILFLCISIIKRNTINRQLRQTKQELEYMASHDNLTKLPNRRTFFSDIEKLLLNKQPLSILLFDIDDFKNINDTYGHISGDDVLREIGVRLNKYINNEFYAYRFAGDEFIIIIQENKREVIDEYLNELLDTFRTPYQIEDSIIEVTISIGIALYPDHGTNIIDLVNNADEAMYCIKKTCKNTFGYYENNKG